MQAVPPPAAPSSDVLDGIGRAFFATLARDGDLRFSAAAALATVGLVAWLVVWVRRETRREREEQAVLDARHAAAMAKVAAADAGREWVSIAVRRPVTVQHVLPGGRFSYEKCETESLSGDSLSFLSRTPPPRGAPLHFAVDLGERSRLSLRGIVRRVEPAATGDAAARVDVMLGPIAETDREHLVRWIALEEDREIVEMRRGRLCVACGRPLANETSQAHATCIRVA
jgi:hypothetical protein